MKIKYLVFILFFFVTIACEKQKITKQTNILCSEKWKIDSLYLKTDVNNDGNFTKPIKINLSECRKKTFYTFYKDSTYLIEDNCRDSTYIHKWCFLNKKKEIDLNHTNYYIEELNNYNLIISNTYELEKFIWYYSAIK